MSKVITFSRQFPSYHPRKGEPTYFVEKFLRSKYGNEPTENYEDILVLNNLPLDYEVLYSFFFSLDWRIKHEPKHHTIRAGNRWKVGDWFSPRVWSGKPYNSKQIIIAPDIQIKKVWDFEMDLCGVYSIDGKYTHEQTDYDLAMNDGLTEEEMFHWFMPNFDKPKEFKGQIICWNENINY